MSIDIKVLNDRMAGIEFRSILNTNFENIKTAFEAITGTGSNEIVYTDVEITDVNVYKEDDIQVCCNDNGIVVKQLKSNVWQTLCQYDSTKSNYISFNKPEAGIGYPIEIEDSELDGKPIGYYNGTKVLAGTVQVEGEDAIHCVGWYKGGNIVKIGCIELEKPLQAGLPIYVLNGGGWTTEIPVVENELIQVIGFVSDDGKRIDIDIQPWCIVG